MTYCSICKGSGIAQIPHVPSQVSKYSTGGGWMDQNYYSSGIPCGACNGTGRDKDSRTSDYVKHRKEDAGSNLKQENTSNASTNLTYEMFLPDTKNDFDFMSLAKAAAVQKKESTGGKEQREKHHSKDLSCMP